MADIATRQNGGRGILSDVFGFDPFRGFYGSTPFASNNLGMDVQRVENGYDVEVPVPGYKPEEIDVTVEDRVLTVSGKTERRQFTRSLILPEEIDAENVEAAVEHGLLTLKLRLHPKAQPRKVAIKVGRN